MILRSHRPKIAIVVFGFILLIVILYLFQGRAVSLPEYWLCKGETSQVVQTDSHLAVKHLDEQYSGRSTLLLEIFRGTVTQYISGPFTGIYLVCSNSNHELSFQENQCDSADSLQTLYKRGMLDPSNGVLVLSEVGQYQGGKILNKGQFQCRYSGNSYPPSVFYKSE